MWTISWGINQVWRAYHRGKVHINQESTPWWTASGEHFLQTHLSKVSYQQKFDWRNGLKFCHVPKRSQCEKLHSWNSQCFVCPESCWKKLIHRGCHIHWAWPEVFWWESSQNQLEIIGSYPKIVNSFWKGANWDSTWKENSAESCEFKTIRTFACELLSRVVLCIFEIIKLRKENFKHSFLYWKNWEKAFWANGQQWKSEQDLQSWFGFELQECISPACSDHIQLRGRKMGNSVPEQEKLNEGR